MNEDWLKIFDRVKYLQEATKDEPEWYFSKETGNTLFDFLTQCYLPEVPRPKIYPTPEHGLSAQWILGNWVFDLEFHSDHTVMFGGINTKTFEEVDLENPTPEEIKKWLMKN